MGVTGWLARRISNYDDRTSLGSGFRARRAQILVGILEEVHASRGEVRLLDVGGVRSYWNVLPPDVLERTNATVTLLNLPGGRGESTPRGPGEERFHYMDGDGCDLHMFGARSFDVAHSNSVIEHVGDWGQMRRFASELARVAHAYFVQTPNYWFPLEPHAMAPFFHWPPKPMRVAMVQRAQLGNWGRAESVSDAVRIVESARLLDRRMLAALFPDAEIVRERVLVLTKSLVAVRKWGAGRAGQPQQAQEGSG